MTGPRRNITTLTPRVEEAGRLMAKGMGNKEIAISMSVSKRVVEGYHTDLVWILGLQDSPQEAKRVLIALYFWGNGDEGLSIN